MNDDARIKKVVDGLWLGYKKYTFAVVVVLVLLIPLTIYVFTIDADVGWIIFLGALSFAAFTEFLSSLRAGLYFKSFLKCPFPIAWTYNNGTVFIMNGKGFIYSDTNHSEIIPTSSFEDLSWDAENLKDIIEDLAKGNFPINGLLPKLKFKTSTNRIPVYNPFNREDKLDIQLQDLGLLKILIMNLEQDSGKIKLSLHLPVPTDIVFGEKEWKQFVGLNMVGMNCDGDFQYIKMEALAEKIISHKA